ncbi:MAG TPA: hypothetical protein VL966_05510 [Alphaproteobacteria bacterium]|nr:hypothetical protein [Alphaproteobacteria bacterium]
MTLPETNDNSRHGRRRPTIHEFLRPQRNSWILDPKDRESGPFDKEGGEDDEQKKSPAQPGFTKD